MGTEAQQRLLLSVSASFQSSSLDLSASLSIPSGISIYADSHALTEDRNIYMDHYSVFTHTSRESSRLQPVHILIHRAPTRPCLLLLKLSKSKDFHRHISCTLMSICGRAPLVHHQRAKEEGLLYTIARATRGHRQECPDGTLNVARLQQRERERDDHDILPWMHQCIYDEPPKRKKKIPGPCWRFFYLHPISKEIGTYIHIQADSC